MLRRIFSKLRSAWRLPPREKFWILLMYPMSGFIRLCVLTLPFKWLSAFYGDFYQNTQLSLLATEAQKQRAWRIGKIAELVSRYTPWESKCLIQALMVRALLVYYGIPHLMHLGAKLTKDQSEPMKAHAWIKVGSWVVSGREGHRAYGITATYLWKPLSGCQAKRGYSADNRQGAK